MRERLQRMKSDLTAFLQQPVAEISPAKHARPLGRVGHGATHAPVDQQQIQAGMSSESTTTESTKWTDRLVLFLRVMAIVALVKGLFHWSRICGIAVPQGGEFEAQTLAYQSATIYFAVIELVAAVGLWLATPWGAVVWLSAVVSMAIVELLFPAVYGGEWIVVVLELIIAMIYIGLALLAAFERPA